MEATTPLRVSLFGVPGAHLNLGVGALRESAVVGLLRRRPDADLTVFDDSWGVRRATTHVDGQPRDFMLCGARNSRRYHRPESYVNMRLSARLGGLRNRGVAVVDRSAAVWDVSGGDSFADLYGRRRFETTVVPKEIALSRGRALLLLPQTYGPFADPALRTRARSVVSRASAAWARDVDSFASMQQLLGSDFDPARHRLGVDLAFGLDPEPLHGDAGQRLADTLGRLRPRPLAGLNVSGLLLKEPDAVRRYSLAVDYRRLVTTVAERLLRDSDAALVLVPHVLGPPGSTDSDEDITAELHRHLEAEFPGRVVVAPRELGAAGRKWLIGQLEWFCGTRMHATIAALSSGVPAAGIAYSLKVRGVFDSCGQADQVVDARSTDTETAVEQVLESWRRRAAVRDRLAQSLPAVLSSAKQQMDEIVTTTADWAGMTGARR